MSHQISDSLTKFIEIKNKLAELEKRYEKYRKIIEQHMVENQISKINHTIDNDHYSIKKTASSRQSISKKDLPSDIWNKYCKSTSYHIITITKNK